jgi:hypothetical protein
MAKMGLIRKNGQPPSLFDPQEVDDLANVELGN